MPNGNQDLKRIVLRIIDANINRCSEGLRVVEEIARFSIEDVELVRKVKELRHEVRRIGRLFISDDLSSRDPGGDVGGRFTTRSEAVREGFEGLMRANFYRAEEALRVIEEFGKIPRPALAPEVKRIRFRLYSLEKEFFSGLRNHRGMPRSPFLYSLIDRGLVEVEDLDRVTASLLEGGSDLLQYRAKGFDTGTMRRDLAAILPAAEAAGVPVIVNDHPELAAETGAGGVHIGEDDPGVMEAREILGPNRIVGVTLHDLDRLDRIPREEIDYIAVGAVFPSTTKTGGSVCGPGMISDLKAMTDLPVVAIGGINPRNLHSVLEAGADGIAVISAMLEGDIRKNCFTFREIIDRKRDEE
jgi:thiamine-phosphate pyrophosphorylase